MMIVFSGLFSQKKGNTHETGLCFLIGKGIAAFAAEGLAIGEDEMDTDHPISLQGIPP